MLCENYAKKNWAADYIVGNVETEKQLTPIIILLVFRRECVR